MRRAVSDQDKERRRVAILRAARREFARRGYHATTIAAVARAAKLSYGSVYWYFDSKDALFHALLDHEAAKLRVHLASPEGAGAARRSPLEAFRDAIERTLEYFAADASATKLLFRDAPSLGPAFERHVARITDEFLDEVEALVLAAQSEGAVADLPSRFVAFAVVALIGQLAQRRLVTDDGLTASEAAEAAVQLLVSGVRRRSSSR